MVETVQKGATSGKEPQDSIRKLIALAAATISVTVPAIAETAITSVSREGGISVGVPAGALDAESALYLVWDSEDHGDELSAWPVANRVAYDGVLSSSAATYYFATNCLPANYCARVIAAKAVNVIDGYIYCGANQCVNTGISESNVYEQHGTSHREAGRKLPVRRDGRRVLGDADVHRHERVEGEDVR